jgi:hypothetical protein
MGRIGQLDQIAADEQAVTALRPRRHTIVESCISGAPAYGGVCVEHGESACVMTLHLAG